MPVAVRNAAPTRVVFSSPTRKESLEWEPKDDPDGGDIQQVPNALTEEAPFLRAVAKGILVIEEDDDALKGAIALQAARYAKTASQGSAALEDLLEGPANGRDLVITEDQIDAHIAATAKLQVSDLDPVIPSS